MKSAKVLVVEDEKVVAIDITNRLMGLGYTVPAVIDSAEEAIKAVAASRPKFGHHGHPFKRKY